MATSVGLNFRLTAAVDKFEASMRDVDRRLNGIEDSSRKTAKGMKLLAGIEVGKALIGGLRSVFSLISSGVSTVTNFANQLRETYDRVGKLSESLGMNAVALQAFLKISELSGMSSDQFGQAVLAMNKRLGEFYNGTGPAKNALERLGLSMEDLKDKTPAQQLRTIAQAIMLLPTKSQQAAAAFAIFGDAGKKILPTLDAIANSAERIAGRSLSLGQFLSPEQVDAIEMMNDAFTEVWKTIQGIGGQVLANLAKPIVFMVKRFEDFVAAYKSFTTNATGGTGLANDITVAILEGAVVLGEWADMLIAGLIKFYTLMASLFEALFQWGHNNFGYDLHSSPEANRLQDELEAIEDKMNKLDKLMAMELIGTEEYNELFKEKNKLEGESVELKKKINKAEQDYFDKKAQAATGMGSIGDAMQTYLNRFLGNGGGGPRGNPFGGGMPPSRDNPPYGPPDNSGMWQWNPNTGQWEGRTQNDMGGGGGVNPPDVEPDMTDADLLSENRSHTEILNRIDANTSGFMLQPVVIG